MRRHFRFLSLAALAASGLSCELSSTRPEALGSISIQLASPSGISFTLGEPLAAVSTDLEPVSDASASIALTSARVIVTGPTNKTVTTSTATGSNFVLTADGLAGGTYAVVVQGLVDGEVAHIGATTGVVVNPGQTTPVTVGFPSFQPVIPAAATTDTTDVLRFTVSYSAVPSATSYIVAWSQSADMAGAQTKTVAETSTEIVVTSEGMWYVTVRAASPLVASGGLASAPKTVFVFQGVATVTVSAPATTLAGGESVQFSAEGRDADNGIVSNVAWIWQSSNDNVAIVDQTGLVTGVGPGEAEITAVGKGTPGTVEVTVTVTPTQLAFTSQPTATVAGEALSPAVEVEVRDASGQRVRSSRIPVSLAIATNPGSGTLSGTATVNAIDGVATFTGVSIDKAGVGYELRATGGTLTDATSSTFDISHAAAARLAFVSQPTTARVGASIGSVEVAVEDRFGNRVRSAAPGVTVGLFSNPSGAELTGSTSATVTDGIATFPDLAVDDPGVGYRLFAAAENLAGAVSGAFSSQLRFYVANPAENTVSVFEASDNSFVTDVDVGTFPARIAVTPDGTRAYVTMLTVDSVVVLDLATNTVTARIPVGDGPQGIAISPDGSLAFVANAAGGSVTVINTANNLPGIPIVVGTFPVSIAFTPDGTKAFVANQNSDNVSVIDVAGGVVSTTIAAGTDPRNVAVSPDGAIAYVTNSSSANVTVIRVQNNSVLTTFGAGEGPLGVEFSPDGGTAFIVNAGTQKLGFAPNAGLSLAHSIVDWAPIGTAARKLAVSPGGSFVYVADFGGNTISVISTVSRQRITTIDTPAPLGIAFGRIP